MYTASSTWFIQDKTKIDTLLWHYHYGRLVVTDILTISNIISLIQWILIVVIRGITYTWSSRYHQKRFHYPMIKTSTKACTLRTLISCLRIVQFLLGWQIINTFISISHRRRMIPITTTGCVMRCWFLVYVVRSFYLIDIYIYICIYICIYINAFTCSKLLV